MSSDINIALTIGTEKFTMNDALEIRQKKQASGVESQSLWEKMTVDYQQVLSAIVRRAIESLHANVDKWLPYCMLDGVGGDKIDVLISVMLSDVEAQVDMLVDATDFEIENAKRRLMEQLSGETIFENKSEFIEHIRECIDRGIRPTTAETERLLTMIG